MQMSDWAGVMPAITTPFKDDDSIDHRAVGHLVGRMLDAGCTAIVTPGSLGEGASLTPEERRELWKTCVAATGGRRPVVAAIASASTREAVALARTAESTGCQGLMVLPPYVYRGDWIETREHVSAIMEATALSCMLYNNPSAYGVDFTPVNALELAGRHANLHAVKDSSGDARRVIATRGVCADRLRIFVGLDDCIVEGVRMGTDGWIAGLVNALPEESVALYESALRERSGGDPRATNELYQWFLPLLRLDTGPKFVQLIKLAQAQTGTERVRPPRCCLIGEERAAAIAVIGHALRQRP